MSDRLLLLDTLVRDGGHHVVELQGVDGVALTKQDGVARTQIPCRRVGEQTARFTGQVQSGRLSDAEFGQVLVALLIRIVLPGHNHADVR